MCLACYPGLAALLSSAATRRDFVKYAALSSTSAILASCGVAPSARSKRAASGSADVIFRGGQILTMNEHQPRADALAIRGDRITAVGAVRDVDALRGPDTRIVELDGRALLPGFIDPHMHFAPVVSDDWIDVSPFDASDYDAVLAKIRAGAQQAAPGDWVLAQGFDPSITTGARTPTRSMLDALVPDNPFYMTESNGHVAYGNTRAFQLAGVNRDTPDPPAGRFVRDADGELTGRLEETSAQLAFGAKLPMPGPAEVGKRVRRLFDRAASVGCTALHDCSIGAFMGASDLTLLRSVMEDDPPIRYRGMLVSSHMDEWEKLGIKPDQGDDRFRITGIKAWSDGSNQAYTGYQRDNYLGKDTRGTLNYSQEQLTEIIRRAHQAGWQMGVHANGDAAIDTTIGAYEAVLRESPRPDHRHRIEHCSVLHPEQIARMSELGLSPSFLIGHVRWWGKAFHDRILGPERARFYDPCASALKGGLRISFHSDWNVTPIEPLRYVEDAVTRVMNEGGDVFFEDERIPVEAALRGITIDAAWQTRMDDIVGSLEPAKLADLTLLERDPTAVSPTQIRQIKVSETWLSGESKHRA